MSSSEWASIRLGEVCIKIGSGATPRGGKETYLDQGPYALVRSQNVLDFVFSLAGLAYINENQANQLNNVEVQEKDILLNITGDSVARVCQVSKEILPARVNQHVSIIRPDSSRLYPEYLKYYLLNPKFKKHMLGLASVGGTRNALTKVMIEDFKIILPPIQTQRRIAEILSALDDKIELNRQTNATLEAITQAIFKEWFVNFNFPGATDEMVESELGMIPKGWRVGCFDDILSQEIGGDWGKDTPLSNSIPAISLRGTDIDQLKNSGYAPDAPIRWVKEDSVQKRRIYTTDILIGGSGLGPIGKSLYCDENLHNLYDFPIIYSNFCKKLRANTPYHAFYAERLLESIYKSGEMKQFFNGTSIPNLDISSLLQYKIILPEDDLLEDYFNMIGKVKFCQLLNKENITISDLRDLLLPKLMNGEIEV